MQKKSMVARYSDLNLIPIGLMSLLWTAPIGMFWFTAFGPMKPYHYPAVNTAPSMLWFLFGLAMCFLPYTFPDAYYQPRAFERTGRVYEALGVRLFRCFVPNGDWINRFFRRLDPVYRVIKGRRSLREYVWKYRGSEKGHTILFLMGLFSTVYAWRIGWDNWAAFLAVGNVLVNLYPILLQRYTRGRIAKILPVERAGESP